MAAKRARRRNDEMLKKFFKEYPYAVIVLILLALLGVIMIFVAALEAIPVIAKCFLIVIGIFCLVGPIVALLVLMYEFEKLEMLKDIKERLIENE